ncbi:hypothetical protein GH714_031148 [Hevea brasiliensis]|uniref:GATA transcription factor n=1 Tax=Hevea brasiliensis TaxID=3981 RepID=A0A6A6NBM1_HEVBR|nr:hypothetical protein GH714_031148 [Hevea brasiliensis]
MEHYCMAARALKSSLRRELASKSTQQAFFEDFLCSNANNGVVSCEDFSVDCFFDFSNGECYIQEQNMLEVVEEEEVEKDSLSVSSQHRVDDDNNSNSSTVSDSLLTSELYEPVDDLAELEWVSQIVNDYSSEFFLSYPLKPESHATDNRFQLQPQQANLTKTSCLFPAPIPAKPRSKRLRPTTMAWSIGFPITDLSSSPSSSSSSPASSSSVLTNTVQTVDSLSTEPPTKKTTKRPTLFQRRCTHCHVQKTPQWRTGPLGAKTLCNACGVRYKSGRLFPEYRPACSPSFSMEVHSNSHRKVLEIRMRKEITGPE